MANRSLEMLGLTLLACCTTAPAQDAKQPAKEVKPYNTAHDAALDSKEAIINEAADHTQYRVEFNGIKKDRVPAYLYVPKRKADAPPGPAILLQYGIGGNKKTDYIVAIGKQFVARGFVVLTIDAPNTGERRDKDNKVSAIFGLLGGDQIAHYCGDYSRAVDYLLTRTEVDKDRVGYVGISWGAITGITYVAHDPRIKAMSSMVGGGNFLGFYSPKTVEKASKENPAASDPVIHVGRIAPRPLLFVNVKKDQLILKSWAESLHQCAGANSKVMWLDCDHYFRGVDRVEVCASVIDFMEESIVRRKK